MPLSESQMPSALNHPSAPDGTRVDQFKPNGVGLSCSGGGYKSGAYQVGAFIRLNEVGMLPKIDRISSVSGGSITAVYLALNWGKLNWQDDVAINFDEIVTALSGQVSAARINSRLVLDLARERIEALEPVTYVVRPDAIQVRLALETELQRVRAARTANMDADVAEVLAAAEAAIAAAAASLEAEPEE